MSDKRRLGKGLGALIPDAFDTESDVEKSEIALEKIRPNPYQPRENFDQEKLEELAQSIREHGVLQAIVVCPTGSDADYYLVAGERRCRAAKLAGLKSIPAIVRSYDNKAMLEIALIENLQREDLNPVEEAAAYRQLMKDYNYTQEDLAQRLGKSRPAIANSVRLLALPKNILDLIARGKLTAGQARPLLTITDQLKQEEFAQKIVEEGLTAREAEKLSERTEKKNRTSMENKRVAAEDPLTSELQLQIQRRLGTKVRIKPLKSGGTIEIHYYGEEDLERLIAKLLPEGL
ncbi:MAG: ParB/RepB/Spo0J family partition protein [Firmicutes bacterium]|nr:ParB/RepB/Spo0J family partition protein [Bacillota bacterium]